MGVWSLGARPSLSNLQDMHVACRTIYKKDREANTIAGLRLTPTATWTCDSEPRLRCRGGYVALPGDVVPRRYIQGADVARLDPSLSICVLRPASH
jgi:hypothetical protein